MESTFADIAHDIRVLSLTMTTQAGSGHPTSCLSCAEILAVLFGRFFTYDPSLPQNPYNDRFILSKGHAAPALYSIYALSHWIPKEEVLSLRQKDSRLEGHPTRRLPFIDVATGSLGQGIALGMGEYIGLQDFSPMPHVCVLLGDGELAEGSVWEAFALAPTMKAETLIAIIDLNSLGQSGPSLYDHNPNLLKTRVESFGWKAQVVDGHDVQALERAFELAFTTKGPHVLIANTHKGKGVSFLEDNVSWHGKALSKEELARALEELGPERNAEITVAKPKEDGMLSDRIRQHSFALCPEYSQEVANKVGFGQAVETIVKEDKNALILDADVKNSTMTLAAFQAAPSQSIEVSIAEQTMVGIATGAQAVGKQVILSTFASFLTRAFDQLRMAALSESRFVINGSYCGSSIGKDGSSQMGLEDIAMMRSLPNVTILYPSDVYSAYALTIEAYNHPTMTYLRTTREPTPILYTQATRFPIGGSHLHSPTDSDVVTIIAAGVTLFEALEAQRSLRDQGISVRVIDLYSIRPLDERTLVSSLAQTSGNVVVVEDHYQEGGIGEALFSFCAANSIAIKARHLAVTGICHSATFREELEINGIDANAIENATKQLLGRA